MYWDYYFLPSVTNEFHIFDQILERIDEKTESRTSYDMSKWTVKNAHQIHLWYSALILGLKETVLCHFYKSQVLQVDIFYISRIIKGNLFLMTKAVTMCIFYGKFGVR